MVENRRTRDGFDPAAQVLDFGDGKRGVLDSEAGRALTNVDEAFLVAIDERAEEDAADQGEDGGVGADPRASVRITVMVSPLARARERMANFRSFRKFVNGAGVYAFRCKMRLGRHQ